MLCFEQKMDLNSWTPFTSSVTWARDQSDIPVRATAIDLHMGVVRTPARAIFKNNLNMLFLNINRAIDTTCIHIDTKCNSNRHNILRNHEIGNDSRIIFKTQICMVPWNSKMQKLKILVACGGDILCFQWSRLIEAILLSASSRFLCCNELCPRSAGFCRGSEMFSKFHHTVWLKNAKDLTFRACLDGDVAMKIANLY